MPIRTIRSKTCNGDNDDQMATNKRIRDIKIEKTQKKKEKKRKRENILNREECTDPQEMFAYTENIPKTSICAKRT